MKRVAIEKVKGIQNIRFVSSLHSILLRFVEFNTILTTFSLEVINTLNEVKGWKHINNFIHEKANKFSRNELISGAPNGSFRYWNIRSEDL